MDYGLKTLMWCLLARQAAISACLGLLALTPLVTLAADAAPASEPKMVSGISIVGNNEAPKSLFIVPWKSSEIGFETGLNSGMIDDSMRPVDKDVFMREIDFYEISHAN